MNIRVAHTSTTVEPLYWNESRRAWQRGDGTRYKSIKAAEAAIKRYQLDGRPVL